MSNTLHYSYFHKYKPLDSSHLREEWWLILYCCFRIRTYNFCCNFKKFSEIRSLKNGPWNFNPIFKGHLEKYNVQKHLASFEKNQNILKFYIPHYLLQYYFIFPLPEPHHSPCHPHYIGIGQISTGKLCSFRKGGGELGGSYNI